MKNIIIWLVIALVVFGIGFLLGMIEFLWPFNIFLSAFVGWHIAGWAWDHLYKE
ncbi:hypothetical protein LCGC14_0702140 [marine sediment metagenome]|uniref:Uncharacterized protein n=1 Tax=marine sediment metagenome TaxID=412755 RepID=A0A0F9R2Y9_9ZZZZ